MAHLLFASCAALLIALAPLAVLAADEQQVSRLAVMDVELIGDLGDAGLAQEHQARAERTGAYLRTGLDRLEAYEVVDNAGAGELIAQLSAVQYLHKCNGCELDIGLALGADQVLVAWVYRVSNLILTLNYQVRDVRTGEYLRRSSFSFRGDNDEAWRRAIDHLIEDVKAPAQAAMLYDMTIETTMPHLEENLRYTAVHERRCLTPAQARSVFPALASSSLSDCKLEPDVAEASTWTLACSADNKASGRAIWSSRGPDQLRGALEVKLGGKNMTFQQRAALTRVGPCTGSN